MTKSTEALDEAIKATTIKTGKYLTFALDEEELKRGLEENTLEVFDLFTNSQIGILPLIDERLENILLEGRGDLALKQTEVITQPGTPDVLAENFRKFTENSTLSTTVQTLIAVA